MDKAILLADKNSNAWKFGELIQQYLQSEKERTIPLREVQIKKFRNGEIDMHVPDNIRGKDVYFIQDSSKDPLQWWVELLMIKDLLLSASAESVSFILPNMLYSRKDRKEKPHVPITARALANSISPHLRRIITMDLHAAQIQGCYPENVPIDNLHSFPSVVKYLKVNFPEDLQNLTVVSPDAGGTDRARAFAQKLGESFPGVDFPLAIISKYRPRAGEVGEMRLTGDVAGKDVLIVDDILDSGGTLCAAADLLRVNGAKKVFCYATHGFFTKGEEDLINCLDRIIVGNTQYRKNDGIKVVDFSPIFAEAIYRAQMGESISELFE